MLRPIARSVRGWLIVCLLGITLAGCSADKAFTPTVTSAPQQASTGAAAPTSVAPEPTATAAENGAVAVSVVLTDYRVSSFTTSFEVGKIYQFNVSNNGAVAHGFTIEPTGANNQPLTANGAFSRIDLINPGESRTLTWTFTAAGDLQMASHLNDDYAKGMVKTGLSAR